jgi:hypothetical protein
MFEKYDANSLFKSTAKVAALTMPIQSIAAALRIGLPEVFVEECNIIQDDVHSI